MTQVLLFDAGKLDFLHKDVEVDFVCVFVGVVVFGGFRELVVEVGAGFGHEFVFVHHQAGEVFVDVV